MKPKKSAKELEAMFMQEARKHPDWDIARAAVTPTVQTAAHHPNWTVQLTMNGRDMAPQAARQFETELSNKFDLA